MSPRQRNARGAGGSTAASTRATGAVGARRHSCAAALASAFLAGEWSARGLRERGRETFGVTPRWLGGLAGEVLDVYHRPPLDRPHELADVIDAILTRRRVAREPRVRRWLFYEAEMGRMRWPVRPLVSVGELAELVEADPAHLAWLADARGLERTAPDERLRHYRYTWRHGRMLERPKVELKRVQRLILREILDAIPPHDAAHGFRRGRSVVTHAQAHAGREVLLRFDLEQFFASVDRGRVDGIFRTAGYPEAVASILAALCLNVVPAAEWAAVPLPDDPRALDAHRRLGRRLAAPHLPQGAPTSPALASLAAFGLDVRLDALARRLGATYTRYADDLAFSGEMQLLRVAPALRAAVDEIVRAEGFHLNPHKSRLTTRAGRQQVCGVVVNAHPNVSRRDYDRLKAIVHNAARHGPGGLDRARLRGRIAWVQAVNARRGEKLLRRFEAISWSAGAGR
jgi:hypothetical protein